MSTFIYHTNSLTNDANIKRMIYWCLSLSYHLLSCHLSLHLAVCLFFHLYAFHVRPLLMKSHMSKPSCHFKNIKGGSAWLIGSTLALAPRDHGSNSFRTEKTSSFAFEDFTFLGTICNSSTSTGSALIGSCIAIFRFKFPVKNQNFFHFMEHPILLNHLSLPNSSHK